MNWRTTLHIVQITEELLLYIAQSDFCVQKCNYTDFVPKFSIIGILRSETYQSRLVIAGFVLTTSKAQQRCSFAPLRDLSVIACYKSWVQITSICMHNAQYIVHSAYCMYQSQMPESGYDMIWSLEWPHDPIRIILEIIRKKMQNMLLYTSTPVWTMNPKMFFCCTIPKKWQSAHTGNK